LKESVLKCVFAADQKIGTARINKGYRTEQWRSCITGQLHVSL